MNAKRRYMKPTFLIWSQLFLYKANIYFMKWTYVYIYSVVHFTNPKRCCSVKPTLIIFSENMITYMFCQLVNSWYLMTNCLNMKPTFFIPSQHSLHWVKLILYWVRFSFFEAKTPSYDNNLSGTRLVEVLE